MFGGRCRWCWCFCFFFSSRRRHTRFDCDWSSDVCSSDLMDSRLVGLLAGGQRRHTPPRQGKSCASYGFHFYLSAALFSRVRGWLTALGLDEGVEVRSPLFDQRIVKAAAPRPHWERRTGRDTKRLLRRAMQGLLPEQRSEERRVGKE